MDDAVKGVSCGCDKADVVGKGNDLGGVCGGLRC